MDDLTQLPEPARMMLKEYEKMRIFCVRRAGWPFDDTSPCHKGIEHSRPVGLEFHMALLLDNMALALKQTAAMVPAPANTL